MAVEALPPLEDARVRLARSRSEIFGLVRELQGYRPLVAQFPRSRLMRLLTQQRRRGNWLIGAILVALLARPRLVWRVLRWTLAQPLLQRQLLPWLTRHVMAPRR